MTEGKKRLPIYLPTDVEEMDRAPCSDCALKDNKSNCRFQPLVLYTKEGQKLPEAEVDQLELLVVADTPSFEDNKARKFWASPSGASLLRRVKNMGVETFAVIPAVRCYPGGDIDHNVLTKKYKGSPKFARETPLDRAKKAVENCKEYVRLALRSYNPKYILAMGPLAAAAMDLSGSIPQLRTQPIRPKPGLKNANPTEGIIVTYDRYEAATNDWAFRDVQRDLNKVASAKECGFASPRGNDKAATIKVLNTVKKVKKFVDWMLTTEFDPQEIMCLDFETENMDLSTETNRLLNVGISRSCDEDVAYVVPLAHPETPFTPDELLEVYGEMKRLFRSEGASFYGWCGHNTQYEVTMIKLFFDEWLGEGGGVKTLDTMVLAYILDEDRSEAINRPYSLETLAQEMLDFRWYGQSAMKSKRDRLSSEAIEDVNTYVGFDAIVTARLVNELLERMQEEGSASDLLRLATKLYGPAIHYTVDLKLTGQHIDVDLLRMLRAPKSSIVHRLGEIEQIFVNAPEVADALAIIQKKAHGGTGMSPIFKTATQQTFSLTSQEHRKALFWDVLELDGAEDSVDRKFQERHKGVKLVDLFSEYQQLSKLDSSYLKPLADWLQSPNSTDGRVRPNFNLVNTRTGRLSASDPNCYDEQTEILTKRGWVHFPDLQDHDEVAQWWSDGNIDFVKPHEVVRQKYDGEMVRLKNQHIDLFITPNHRCPLRHRKSGKLTVVEARSYREDYKQHHAGVWKGGKLSVPQHMISLVCAAQADGSWRSDVKRGAMELSFSKQRKIDRLRDALLKAGAVFTENPKGEDSTRFYVSMCPALEYVLGVIGYEKSFSVDWLLSLDRDSLDLFVDEINHWDGCFTRNNQYTSTVKHNVDVVQIAMTLSDLRATVNRHGSKDTTAWSLYQTQRNYSMTTNVEKVKLNYSGQVYCVAVPSSFVVVRRNGFTAVCGNTQNVPRSDSTAKKQIKGMFKATDGKVLVQLDFSQAEVRWLGILSGDEALAEKYKMADEIEAALLKDPSNEELKKRKKIDGDLHMSTAIMMYKLDPDLPIRDEKEAKKFRQRAKSVCFGLIYGKSSKSLAKDLGIDDDEAEEAVDLWLSQFPKAAAWLTSMEDYAVEHGYVKSAFGRWRRLPEVQSNNISVVNRAKRQSRNTPIQSAASDGCIYAACRLRDALRTSDDPKLRQVRLINTVHDSLIAELPTDPDIVRAYCKLAKSIFTDRNLLKKDFGVDIIVPLAVDFDIGLNWGNMTDYDFTEKALHRAMFDAEVLRRQPPGTLLSDLKGKGLLFDEQTKKEAA
jgi:DNA polymerase I-like protein with 3'-5' exonuclease and polymerase domains/uracil-DNA glycosylase